LLVDDVERFAEIWPEHKAGNCGRSPAGCMTAAEKAQYAYTANVMNDVHMSHAMEFPYPQSMMNCATCHEGKLDMITGDANFTATTCKSCHPVTAADGTESNRAPSLLSLWEETGTDSFHSMGLTCNDCHKAGGVGPAFSALHTGYDPVIYTADGTRYSDAFVMTVDDAVLNGNILTIKFHATETVDIPGLAVTDIVPTVMVGLYGYDTIQYRVPSHDQDADGNRLEYVPGTNHPRFTTVSAANGMWEVTADLSGHADLIADGTVKRVEIGVMVDLRTVVGAADSRSNRETDDIIFGMNAPSRTFDLGANAFGGAYSDVIDIQGCNSCHDLLATTFHGPIRGGNIKICKMCHGPTTRGSHLELASREISNYVHAIHSFQPFDPGDVDFADPVETMRYDLHVEHVFPNFTIKNCESCHNEGTYDVPDQSKSLPSLHAGTDTWSIDRNIGTIGQFVTGPASRACGACHRAEHLKEDNAGGLAAFQQHVKAGGYVVNDGSGVYDAVVEKIMGMFQ
jgi:OmcA/MtrC family decaheme c-type cytochrome